MSTERAIQAAVTRADLLICAVWPYTRAALLAAGIALALWVITQWRARGNR
jgi:hypothetical protein